MEKRNRLFALMMVLCGLLPFAHAEPAEIGNGNVRLYSLNIGKADCMLLLCGEKTYLIDTGYEHTYPALACALQQLNITHLDGVFLTHCHQDHEGGLMPLVKSDIAIDHLYAAKIYYDVKESKHPALLAAKERKMQVEFLQLGDVIQVDDETSFTVLGPVSRNEDNENNNSLVMRFASPHGSILFTGDMKLEEENDLLQRNLITTSDVLKCGHHGDNNATSMALLRAVRPKCAVILTSSREEPDTPSPDTLNRLRTMKCDVHISQNYQDALCVTLENGIPTVSDIAWPGIPKRIYGLQAKIRLANDAFILTNTKNEQVTLSGCFLYSSKGDDAFPLRDISLNANESIVIGSKKTKDADITIDKKTLWHEKKKDIGILYDAYGRILAVADNGLKEK